MDNIFTVEPSGKITFNQEVNFAGGGGSLNTVTTTTIQDAQAEVGLEKAITLEDINVTEDSNNNYQFEFEFHSNNIGVGDAWTCNATTGLWTSTIDHNRKKGDTVIFTSLGK